MDCRIYAHAAFRLAMPDMERARAIIDAGVRPDKARIKNAPAAGFATADGWSL
jgi:hypothetical protein